MGGHAGLLARAGRVFKPLPAGVRGQRELEFYETVNRAERRHDPPACFMPQYHGTWVRDMEDAVDAEEGEDVDSSGVSRERVPSPAPDSSAAGASESSSGSGQQYIQLEDLTAPFTRPSIMDIKVGVQAWDEDALPPKIGKEACKYPTQQLVGFRMTGMRVWDRRHAVRQLPDGRYESCAGHFREHGRAFGYKLTQATLGDGFREFLFDGERVRYEAVPPFLDRLLAIRHWMASQAEFRLYGSSLLFIYEGDVQPGAPPRVDLRMIDFAHVWPIRQPAQDGSATAALDANLEAGRPTRTAAPTSESDFSASESEHEAGVALTSEQDDGHVNTGSSGSAEGNAAIARSSLSGATARRSRAAPVTSDERDSGYLLGLDSIINYLLALLARKEPELAAWYQLKWEEQDRLPGSRPVLVHGHHFHHTTPEGDAAALSFTPRGAAATDRAPAPLR